MLNYPVNEKVALVFMVLAFGVGLYCGQFLVDSPTQVSEVTNTGKKTHRVITTTKDKDGKKVTQVVEDSITNTTKTKQETKSIKGKTTNISVLGGVTLSARPELVYGVSISKQAIGPTTIGLFGLTNGILGASIGLNF